MFNTQGLIEQLMIVHVTQLLSFIWNSKDHYCVYILLYYGHWTPFSIIIFPITSWLPIYIKFILKVSSHLSLGLTNNLFLCIFLTTYFTTFIAPLIRARWPAHVILLQLLKLSYIDLLPLLPNIFHNPLFSSTLTLSSEAFWVVISYIYLVGSYKHFGRSYRFPLQDTNVVMRFF